MSKVMLTPEQQIRQRYVWFELAAQLGNVRLACIRLGISRKSFYKWRKRFEVEQGRREALRDGPRRKVKKALRRRLLTLRQRTHLGPERRDHREGGETGGPHPEAPRQAEAVSPDVRGAPTRRPPSTRCQMGPLPGRGAPVLPVRRDRLLPRLRLVSLAEEMTIATAKAFAQYVLSTFPFLVRMVQTDNDSIFTHWDHRGAEDALGPPGESPSVHRDGRVLRGATPADPPADAPAEWAGGAVAPDR